MVLRTRGAVWRSRPSSLLVATTALVALVALALPFTGPVASALGLVPLPASLVAMLIAVTLAYVATTELVKWRFGAMRSGLSLRKRGRARRSQNERPEVPPGARR